MWKSPLRTLIWIVWVLRELYKHFNVILYHYIFLNPCSFRVQLCVLKRPWNPIWQLKSERHPVQTSFDLFIPELKGLQFLIKEWNAKLSVIFFLEFLRFILSWKTQGRANQVIPHWNVRGSSLNDFFRFISFGKISLTTINRKGRAFYFLELASCSSLKKVVFHLNYLVIKVLSPLMMRQTRSDTGTDSPIRAMSDIIMILIRFMV